ncbi:MAG TPA: flagellar basal-body rod protein FlgF [Chromatiaceae bacterium]|jgi:flagellar basal-body rod protein FlgF|nr:flagellar basal-body rod protein FlgF [Chromatiaceae bacterium]HIA08600.1 flagellar basal-body rod protein FlgF [Chromatiaceae bacterium]HIN82703.1 flagellar basal-body rod protein FlgF [Chromatiales bacterium]HIO14665.1 flagellar basal-body rod protein FlgF [Chromatiales bacterium]HIO53763.1 flagellar basal-body rod protein FlgF [Chromatiales bacterium]
MDRMMFVAMTGATQILTAQSANANNLANANTTGFRSDETQFRSLSVFGPGHPARAYALAERPAINFQGGPIQSTGRDLDIALEGEGWISVQSPDGSEAYTRAGDLRLDSGGVLVTGTGLPVLGNGGPIAIPPADKIQIGKDGTITIRPEGQPAATLAVIDRIKLVKPDLAEMIKGVDGSMRLQSGEPAIADASVRVSSGQLEGSNVNPVEAMTKMIELGRLFEMQIKMMKTANENEAASAELMKLS